METSEAINILEQLADGVDPITGEVYDRDSPYQHAEIVRALVKAIDALELYSRTQTRTGKKKPTREDVSATELGFSPRQQMIYEALRKWRNDRAGSQGFKSYMVAHNSWLRQMVAMPVTKVEDLERVRGFGAKRIAQYGDEIVSLLKEYETSDGA